MVETTNIDPSIALFTNTPNNVLSKPLAALPHNRRRNSGRGEKSCPNDYYQSSERMLAEPRIEPATSHTSFIWNCFEFRHVLLLLRFKAKTIESIYLAATDLALTS